MLLPAAAPWTGSAFLRVTRRKTLEISIVSTAVWLRLAAADGPIVEARVCLGSVAPTPIRAPSAENELRGHAPTDEVLARAAAGAVHDARPIDDLRAGAAYRRRMVEVLTLRALRQALARARSAEGGAR